LAIPYDNINVSNAINNLTAGLQGNLEELTAEIRNHTEISLIGNTDGHLTTMVDNQSFQITDIGSNIYDMEDRLSKVEKQMDFLINMFKKFEEIDPDGNIVANVPVEALDTYNLKNELKFK